MPAELDARLVEEAERLDRSVSWVIVQAIERAVMEAPEILERAEMNRRAVLASESQVGQLPQRFKCGVCGQKTIGGYCDRHGEKHAEAL